MAVEVQTEAQTKVNGKRAKYDGSLEDSCRNCGYTEWQVEDYESVWAEGVTDNTGSVKRSAKTQQDLSAGELSNPNRPPSTLLN